MLDPIKKFKKVAILHRKRDWNHCLEILPEVWGDCSKKCFMSFYFLPFSFQLNITQNLIIFQISKTLLYCCSFNLDSILHNQWFSCSKSKITICIDRNYFTTFGIQSDLNTTKYHSPHDKIGKLFV